MTTGFRISHALIGILLLACFADSAGAASIGIEWKERPFNDAPFTGVKFSENGTYVWAGGDQMILRSWDGLKRWGGKAGSIAAMSDDGGYVVQGMGQGIILLENTMVELWTRNMGGQVKAVAISKNANYIITADDQGHYNSWARNGDFNGRAEDDVAKQIAISADEKFIVATTEDGLRIYSPTLVPIWSDNKTSNIDKFNDGRNDALRMDDGSQLA